MVDHVDCKCNPSSHAQLKMRTEKEKREKNTNEMLNFCQINRNKILKEWCSDKNKQSKLIHTKEFYENFISKGQFVSLDQSSHPMKTVKYW